MTCRSEVLGSVERYKIDSRRGPSNQQDYHHSDPCIKDGGGGGKGASRTKTNPLSGSNLPPSLLTAC